MMHLENDYKRYASNSLKGKLKPLISPGFISTIVYRVGNYLHSHKYLSIMLPIYFVIELIPKYVFGISISRKAEIGRGLYIGHHGNVIVSRRAIIGNYLSISHEVTIGVSGQGEKYGAPILGDNVYLAPGSKIFGKITIGENVKIGANAVVYKDVPSNSIVIVEGGCKIISNIKIDEPNET
jgi:serine O-acetyltransferase